MTIEISRRTLGLAALVAILLGLAWYFGSPRWTLYEMRSAAQARDSQALAEYVDFPALRDSLKGIVGAAAAQEIADARKPGGNRWEALGAVIGMGVANTAIDAMITPQALQVMFVNAPSDDDQTDPTSFHVDEHGTIVNQGLNQFEVPLQADDGRSGTLVFKRYGLGWKLAGMNVPIGTGAPPNSETAN